MDSLINKGKAALSGGGGNKTTTTGQTGQQGGGDMLDKGINSVQAKFGMDKTGKYDKYEEKASDMARGQFEKGTGKHVPAKFSN